VWHLILKTKVPAPFACRTLLKACNATTHCE